MMVSRETLDRKMPNDLRSEKMMNWCSNLNRIRGLFFFISVLFFFLFVSSAFDSTLCDYCLCLDITKMVLMVVLVIVDVVVVFFFNKRFYYYKKINHNRNDDFGSLKSFSLWIIEKNDLRKSTDIGEKNSEIDRVRRIFSSPPRSILIFFHPSFSRLSDFIIDIIIIIIIISFPSPVCIIHSRTLLICRFLFFSLIASLHLSFHPCDKLNVGIDADDGRGVKYIIQEEPFLIMHPFRTKWVNSLRLQLRLTAEDSEFCLFGTYAYLSSFLNSIINQFWTESESELEKKICLDRVFEFYLLFFTLAPIN